MLVLEWLTSRMVAAHREGLLVGGAGSETVLLQKVTELRAACMGIPDELAARIINQTADSAWGAINSQVVNLEAADGGGGSGARARGMLRARRARRRLTARPLRRARRR